MICKSYKEWQENPIATSITTHPIDDLEFPNVTICPPKDSNTALYHDLVKAGNGCLSDENRKTLNKAAFEIFIEPTHKAHVKEMLAFQNIGNMNQVLQGFHSLLTPYNDANGLKIKMWNLNGTITTPWFGGDFVGELYERDRDFLMVLDLPDDIRDQVGSGYLLIDLEVDTREAPGWFEEVSLMPNFTLHTTEKTWAEAESECQKEGGHLASVTSEEVNQVVKNVAGVDDNYVWLGGRKEDRKWTWSDKSTWGYHDLSESYSECVQFYKRWWRTASCLSEYQFICQKNNILKGKKAMSLVYSQDRLSFSSFLVWYKYKAVSQQFLDSLKDKRMTGLRLSWRIENMILTASIGEVGRSVETPYLSDALAKTSQSIMFKVALAPPNDLIQEMTNSSLVIELDINKKQSDEVFAFSSFFKMYVDDEEYVSRKSWQDAKLHCKSKGGQLASIHSIWEQTLAEKAAEGNDEYVWLGGRKIDGQWQWEDNATWRFENWGSGRSVFTDEYEYLQMYLGEFLEGELDRGEWIDYESSETIPFLCQGPTAALTESGSAAIEFSKRQVAFFPFHLLFKSHIDAQPTKNSLLGEDRQTSGFSLNWFLKDINGTRVTEKLPARQDDWKQETPIPTPSYKQSLLYDMVQLAKELRLQNMTKKEIFKEVIHQKTQTSVMTKAGSMCSMGQVKAKEQKPVFSNLLSKVKTTQSTEKLSVEDRVAQLTAL